MKVGCVSIAAQHGFEERREGVSVGCGTILREMVDEISQHSIHRGADLDGVAAALAPDLGTLERCGCVRLLPGLSTCACALRRMIAFPQLK